MCDKVYYDCKVVEIDLLEQRCAMGEIDLYFGDETRVSEEGYVPYGWQCRGENIAIGSSNGRHINCFGMITRENDFVYGTTADNIDSGFIIEQLDRFSFRTRKHTVIVLDNAKVHRSKKMEAMRGVWAKKGMYIFFLPLYSPHLNIVERVWKELKARWLTPKDYTDSEQLFYSTKLILNELGNDLYINFKKINLK